ncbi:MAG TPA: hypothetical protein VKA69_06510 [Desulfobacteria bacterium]|nr:hypothetical protein [Desulfobacteria bacterium]
MGKIHVKCAVFALVGIMGLLCSGCSSDSDSSAPSNLSTRVNVLSAGNGILAPVVESTEERVVSAADQIREYTLTLENVSESTLWYTDRPERESGKETIQAYINRWSATYALVSPNAVLDGYGSTETRHDGLFLKLKTPLYDLKTNRLIFQVTLLGSTMSDQHPDTPIDMGRIKLTVLNNTPEGEQNYWSFGQPAQGAFFEPTGEDGLYRLYFIDFYAELFQLQNAPGSGYKINSVASLAANWQSYFRADPPNASLTAYTTSGQLQLFSLELSNPFYQDNIFSYDARVLFENEVLKESLSDATLLIDAPDTQPIKLTVINNCSEDVQVLINENGVWKSGGKVKCAGGKQCSVAPGEHSIDIGSSGMDFFVGSTSDNATKAEVTYLTELSFDISVITDGGDCPNSCKESSCCEQNFNKAVKITPDAGCRCVYCDSVTCPDAFHYPTDNGKQVNCAASTAFTIEFCPSKACPSSGWRDCTSAEMAICHNSSDQPCNGDQTICCPKPGYGATHVCYCETKQPYCASAPDPAGPCGTDRENYCYVTE